MEDFETPPDLIAKEDQGRAGFQSLGRLYGCFIKSFREESGASERVAADVLIAHIESKFGNRKDS